MKKLFILLIIGLGAIISSYSFKSPLKEPTPPSGYSGAPTQSRTCINCHGDFSLNTAGGSVSATGLPTGFYVAGQVYNFSITITNASPMQNWGFEIKAVIAGTSGTALGTFSTTNPNATVVSNELKDNVAVVFNGTSYTYTNLKWTAPSTGSSLVSFYMTGLAGDNDGSEAGDYIYSSTILSVPIPVTLGEIKGKLLESAAIIEWNTYSESGSKQFEVERSSDGRNFKIIQTVSSDGNSNTTKNYSCVDNTLPENESLLYYRLKMVDLDGSFEYSKVIVLRRSLTTYIEKIYPTVIKKNDIVNLVMISNTAQQAAISIYSFNGQLMYSQSQTLARGKNDLVIRSFNIMNPGMYILKIKAGNFADTRKLIIQ